jgi:hypothetical protein
MTMGTRRASNGTACRLVKGEWDLIEAWLKKNIDERRR